MRNPKGFKEEVILKPGVVGASMAGGVAEGVAGEGGAGPQARKLKLSWSRSSMWGLRLALTVHAAGAQTQGWCVSILCN